MALVAAFTGMRWGEVCGMRRAFLHVPGDAPGAVGGSAAGGAWYVIDPQMGAVHEDVHSRRFFGPPKGGYGRVVDLPPFLADLLARHIKVVERTWQHTTAQLHIGPQPHP